MKFSTKDLTKSLMENFIFCAVLEPFPITHRLFILICETKSRKIFTKVLGFLAPTPAVKIYASSMMKLFTNSYLFYV